MEEKLISFCIPSYNSQAYMRKCIESCLVGGEDVEIIIVNDGSKDDTGKIADEYAEKYPSICRAIHQENGGHGEGVNQGIRNAKGVYLKIVDSDDWVDGDALKKILETIKSHREHNIHPDLYISNFVYEHVADNAQIPRRYDKYFPEGKVFVWDEMKPFRLDNSLLMHSLLYKVSVLRDCGLELPKHTFYVDNLYAHVPLPFVKTIYYINVDFYRYFIGRADQSVNFDVFANRTEQQNRVMLAMCTSHHLYDMAKDKSLKKLAHYMLHNLNALMSVTFCFTYAKITKEKKQALKTMFAEIKKYDKKVYGFLKHRSYTSLVSWMPTPIARFFIIRGYNFLNRKLKLSK